MIEGEQVVRPTTCGFVNLSQLDSSIGGKLQKKPKKPQVCHQGT